MNVLVTGCSAGIGLHIVKSLLSQDVHVIGISRRASDLTHNNFTHIRGDLCDSATRDNVVREVQKRGHLHGVVFNAGILGTLQRIEHLSMTNFQNVFDVNVFSIVALTSELVPYLRGGGRAIFVSSGASSSGYAAWSPYGASKAAINLFALTLAHEEPDIVSLSVAPGVVDTDMQTLIREKHTVSGELSPSDARKFLDLKSQNKLVKPEDSGRLYANLALGASKELSGQYLRYNDPKLSAYA